MPIGWMFMMTTDDGDGAVAVVAVERGTHKAITSLNCSFVRVVYPIWLSK